MALKRKERINSHKPLKKRKDFADAMEEAHERRKQSWAEIFGQTGTYECRKKKRNAIKRQQEAYRQAEVRDGHRCRFPGCESKETEHHHVRFRSAGGQDDVENVLLLCFWHHRGLPESPHQSEFWRRYWVQEQAKLYPKYFGEVDISI